MNNPVPRTGIWKRLSGGEGVWYLQYMFNIGVHLSQFVSVLLGGDPDETLSSRIGKATVKKKWFFVHVATPFINWLTGEDNHCIKAIEFDEGKKTIWDWSK